MPGLLTKLVPEGGDTIAGVWVPGGTRVSSSLWSQQRDGVYGEDGDRFWPERWIEADKERRVAMERQLDCSFGVGRWAYLGKPVAWMELNKVFVEVSANPSLLRWSAGMRC